MPLNRSCGHRLACREPIGIQPVYARSGGPKLATRPSESDQTLRKARTYRRSLAKMFDEDFRSGEQSFQFLQQLQ
jgi:hypothetical protein